ncbi:MAG: PQQ-binding-like beta-propeller repeat protein [Acidobacteriota bacterium]
MKVLIIVAIVLSVSAQVPPAREWTQWRGPNRDGIVPAAQAPADWPAAFGSAWRVEIGEGYSSPVVAGTRVFVHSRKDPKELVTAIDLATGKTVWQQAYDAPYQKNQYAVRMGKGPNATPLVAGGRLFTLGATGILNAWDTASGKRLWEQNYTKEVDFSKLFCGTAASPVLAHGLVVVQVGSDVHGGRILGLDPATGATKWQWRGSGPGYASPVIITVGATSQLVTMTNQSIVGLDARTGRELWTAPFPDEWHENIVTPTWTGRHLIVSGSRQGTQAYTVTETGGTWQAKQIWKVTDASMYMSTPVAGDGFIYGMSDKRKGHFVALDESTGAVKWATEGREGDFASVLLTPKHVLFLTNGADLVVARRGGTFAIEKKYDLGASETWSAPVIVGRDLVIRDAGGVSRLSGK